MDCGALSFRDRRCVVVANKDFMGYTLLSRGCSPGRKVSILGPVGPVGSLGPGTQATQADKKNFPEFWPWPE